MKQITEEEKNLIEFNKEDREIIGILDVRKETSIQYLIKSYCELCERWKDIKMIVIGKRK